MKFAFCGGRPPSLLLSASLVVLAFPGNVYSGGTPVEQAPWDELKSELSSPDILQAGSVVAWKEECVPMFEDEGFPYGGFGENPLQNHSNYELVSQPSGQCMDHLACAYKDCAWPFDPADAYDPDDVREDRLDLPAMILHPASAGDIVRALRFASEHKVPLTVKTSGHSYMGASTRAGTLLINMSKYPTYSIYDSPEAPMSLIEECPSTLSTEGGGDTSAVAMACRLATARGRSALLRAGGGEPWDKPLRSVWYFNQEAAAAGDQEYHIVTGAAGTVSAAGGWLASGGLSGSNGMRMFGLGVDQVLHMEMVLPDGTHVRFGPSDWANTDGYLFPKTTEVTGFCNANPLEIDETKWVWEACDNDINFEDLWLAVRGGGGGTWGVVTSVYYQLPDKPGNLSSSYFFPSVDDLDFWGPLLQGDFGAAFRRMYLDFHIDFFFNPSALDISESDSNNCNSPVFAMDPFGGFSFLFCFNGAAEIWASAWRKYITVTHKDELVALGLNDDNLAELGTFAQVSPEQPAFAIPSEAEDGGVPAGRIPDSPRPYLLSDGGVPVMFWNIPASLLVDRRDDLIPLLQKGGNSYVLGGAVRNMHDQMAAIPQSRRDSGFLTPVFTEETAAAFLEIIMGQDGGSSEKSEDVFPGIMCHNHFHVDSYGPLKDDWKVPCPLSLSTEEKMEQCMSQQEGVYGTELLTKLEEIKPAIDPQSLFTCDGGIGFGGFVTQAASPMETPGPSAAAPMGDVTLMPTGAPSAAPVASAGNTKFPIVLIHLVICAALVLTWTWI